MAQDFSEEGVKEISSRVVFCYGAVFVLLLFILSRLFVLQVVRGQFFWIIASEHKFKEIRIPPPRGLLLDRHGQLLVENRASFDLILIPQHVHDWTAVAKTLGQLAGIPEKLFDEVKRRAGRQPPFYPIRILDDIPYEIAARIRVHEAMAQGGGDPYDLRGVEVIPKPLRRYPDLPVGALTLGLVGEVSETQLKNSPVGFKPGDLVGTSGIEKAFDPVLRGIPGTIRKVIDARGREVSVPEVRFLTGVKRPVPGKDLRLTLDRDLQRVAEKGLEGRSGAVVVLDLRSGEVLVLASLPSFDPNRLAANISGEEWKRLITDPRKLFLNRALQSYPPGSTFKPVTALAGLEEGEVTQRGEPPEMRIYCPGGFHFGGRFFRCWQEAGHGSVGLHQALTASCDTFFYQLGLKLGVDRIARYASLLGLGQKTGLGLTEEKRGLVPTTDWKRRTFGSEWLPGENLSVAVGQGALLVTPLQNAVMIATLVNGGKRITPHLIQGQEAIPEETPFSEDHLKRIREALIDVVADPSGTAYGSRSSIATFGGKTGTAQVISEEGRQRAGGGESLKDHAWFVAFAPARDPEIAVSVLVEHGGFGASAAAPIAKAVIEKYAEGLAPEGK